MNSAHSILLSLGLTHATIQKARILDAERKVKGISLFPFRSIIAAEINGPTKEEVLLIRLNNAKKRASFPRGQTSETILSLTNVIMGGDICHIVARKGELKNPDKAANLLESSVSNYRNLKRSPRKGELRIEEHMLTHPLSGLLN